MNISGVHTALITPFLADGSVDWKGLETLIEYQIAAGVQGILLLGTTAETPALTKTEKKEILTRSITQIQRRVPVMVGVGSNNTSETIANCLQAQELGANSVLVVSPYYNKPTQQGLFLHFQAIAENTEIPIVVYNIAGRTGVNINTNTMEKIAALPTVIGVKEASGSIDQIMEVIDRVQNARADFTVTSGDDSLTLPLIALGGKGIISVVSNLFPKEVVELCNAALAGDFVKARKKHFELLTVFKNAFIETNPAPIKYWMKLRNLPAGECRLPLCELLDESKSSIMKVNDSLNF